MYSCVYIYSRDLQAWSVLLETVYIYRCVCWYVSFYVSVCLCILILITACQNMLAPLDKSTHYTNKLQICKYAHMYIHADILM